jgi:5-(carboxyamino)imidazole ribonucleotide synthase
MILPDSTLGMIGGGQLARMFTIAARSMGYRVIILDPDPHSPAGSIADQHIKGDFTDHAALDMLGDYCAVITAETENLPPESLIRLQGRCKVRPSPEVMEITQDRLKEKTWLDEHDFPTVAFYTIQGADELEAAMEDLDQAGILKVARPRFPGQGQHMVESFDEALEAYQVMGEQPCILEERIFVEKRLSVILARGIDGETETYPVIENIYRRGLLETSIAPAAVDEEIEEPLLEIACELADELDYCGVLAVDFFLAEGGDLLINTVTPRPHNCGHLTIDACVTSQFEQQVRTLCGLPPGDAQLLSPVVMINLMGDLWSRGEPRWDIVFREPQALLSLYGKRTARPGRKMGHINFLSEDADKALELAEGVRAALVP